MPTDNNNKSARSYQLEFIELLTAVFEQRAYFRDFFGGSIEAMDGIQNNENAFYVKTSDIPVAIGTYNTGDTIAFKGGTGDTTRFGERTEIIYTNTPVPYDWVWKFHEGIDRHTVNNDFASAIADRLDLQAQAKIAEFNRKHSLFISNTAYQTFGIDADKINGTGVLELFNTLSTYFTNIESVGVKRAKVTPEIWNMIIDHNLTTIDKRSSVNIDDNDVVKFKGFVIEEIPEAMFQGDEVVYAYIENVGKAFTGISTSRTMESEDFDGIALQGAGRAGEFILDDNKKAVVKVEKITIIPIPMDGVTVAPSNATGTSGVTGSKKFTPTFNPTNASNQGVTYTITSASGLTIDGDGLVVWTDAVTAGAYTITIQTNDGAFTDTATLTLSD